MYEMLLAIDLLMGIGDREGGARRFLKFNPSDPARRISACWGAAWDLAYIRLLDTTSHVWDSAAPVALLTADKDPAFVRRCTQVLTVAARGGRRLPQIGIRGDLHHPVSEYVKDRTDELNRGADRMVDQPAVERVARKLIRTHEREARTSETLLPKRFGGG